MKKIYIGGGIVALFIYWCLLQGSVTGVASPFDVVQDASGHSVASLADVDLLEKKMGQVQSLLEKDQKRQALLLVKDISQVDPQNERAKILLGRLSDQVQTQSQSGKPNMLEQKFEEGWKTFQIIQEQLAQKQWAKGYPALVELMTEFQGEDVKPPYFSSLAETKKKTEEILQNNFAIATAQLKEDLLQERWKKVLNGAGEILNVYPDNAQVLSWKKEALQERDRELQPLLMQAETRLHLEGCRSADPFLRRVLAEAAVQELVVWQKASSDYKECQDTLLSQNDPGDLSPKITN